MKIASVLHQFPPDYTTGTEILCLRSAQALAQRGHQMRIFAADRATPAGRPSRRDVFQGLDVRRIGSGRRPRMLLARRIEEEAFNEEATEVLLPELAAFAPDIIHLYQAQQFGLNAVPAMARLAPIIATMTDFHVVCPLITASFEDGTPCDGPGLDGAICTGHLRVLEAARPNRETGLRRAALAFREGVRRLPAGDTPARLHQAITGRMIAAHAALSSVDLTLVGPPRLYEMLSGLSGVNIELFGHAAPPLAVPPRSVGETLCIGYFSSISRHKGLHVLLDAAAMIPQDIAMIFTICGPAGPDRLYVRDMMARAAADPRITMRLGVPHDEMGAELGNADIVVIPSLWDENNPLVLLDALEAGRYIVASASPGMIAALDEPAGGIAVPAGNAAALAAALIGLSNNRAPVENSRANPVRASQFPAYIDAIEARYAALLGKGGRVAKAS